MEYRDREVSEIGSICSNLTQICAQTFVVIDFIWFNLTKVVIIMLFTASMFLYNVAYIAWLYEVRAIYLVSSSIGTYGVKLSPSVLI